MRVYKRPGKPGFYAYLTDTEGQRHEVKAGRTRKQAEKRLVELEAEFGRAEPPPSPWRMRLTELEADPIRFEDLPPFPGLPAGAYAVRVATDSLFPPVARGGIIVATPDPPENGDLALVKLRGGGLMVKVVLADRVEERRRLEYLRAVCKPMIAKPATVELSHRIVWLCPRPA